jgi:hypothetical protein
VIDDQTVCTQCRRELQTKDWTCPRCGAIVARYLFSTVTLKSLEGEGRNAYQAGYQDCIKQAGQTGSPAIRPESYHPTIGNETAYRAGWQAAAGKLDAKADRKFGRRRGLRVLGAGVVTLFVGLGIAYVTASATNGRVTLLAFAPIGLGALNIVLGIVMLITGSNDEARPDAGP